MQPPQALPVLKLALDLNQVPLYMGFPIVRNVLTDTPELCSYNLFQSE